LTQRIRMGPKANDQATDRPAYVGVSCAHEAGPWQLGRDGRRMTTENPMLHDVAGSIPASMAAVSS